MKENREVREEKEESIEEKVKKWLAKPENVEEDLGLVKTAK